MSGEAAAQSASALARRTWLIKLPPAIPVRPETPGIYNFHYLKHGQNDHKILKFCAWTYRINESGTRANPLMLQ